MSSEIFLYWGREFTNLPMYAITGTSLCSNTEQVKDRTSNHNTYAGGSHLMQYGNQSINLEKLYLYQGSNPATENIPPDNGEHKGDTGAVNKRSADPFFLWQKVMFIPSCLLCPDFFLV